MLSDFLRELARRRVIRVALLYLVSAWVAIQVAATVFPILEFPDWTTKFVVVLSIVGLPVALGLAWAFDINVQRATPATDGDRSVHASPALPRAHRLAFVAALVLIVAPAAGWFAWPREETMDAATLDANLIAVLPFRVSGTGGALDYLRDGMVDLMAVKFSGRRRAVEPRTALAAWRDIIGEDENAAIEDARRVAYRLGARTLLLGAIVGSGQRVTLSATLVSVADGREIARTSQDAPADSLTALVDRVTAVLLSLEAGESEQDIVALTNTPRAALDAYLDGNARYREGDYNGAVASWMRALDIDSTFVLAALNVPTAAGMMIGQPGSPGSNAQNRAVRLMRRYRDRFSAADRAYVDARWPEQATAQTTTALQRMEELSRQLPDRPDIWYQLGDQLFHSGAVNGIENWLERSRAAFERAVALDSTFIVPLQHLVWIAYLQGDTAFIVRTADRYLAREPNGIAAHDLRSTLLRIRGDSAGIARMEMAIDTMPLDVLTGMTFMYAFVPGPEGVKPSRRGAQEMLRRAATDAERRDARRRLYEIERNAGRTAAAEDALQGAADYDRRLILDALYWDGDTVSAAAAVARVEPSLRRTPGFASAPANDLCTVQLWHTVHGRTRDVDAAVARLLRTDSTGTVAPANRVCAEMLHLLRAHHERRPDTDRLLTSLDSLLLTPAGSGNRAIGNITVARLFEARGDFPRAFAAAKRVVYNVGGQVYMSTFLELQGRYAAAVGDLPFARSAYTSYLRMRQDAEPSLRPHTERVRSELARLAAEPRQVRQ